MNKTNKSVVLIILALAVLIPLLCGLSIKAMAEEYDTANAVKIIGIDGPGAGEQDIHLQTKPAFQEVEPLLPATIRVLSENGESDEVSVRWKSAEDFDHTDRYYYVLFPELPGQYSVPDDLELPYIVVWIDGGQGQDGQGQDGQVQEGGAIEGEEENVMLEPSFSPGTLRGSGNEEKTFYFLIDVMKLNNAAAAGIVSNIRAESNFRPNALGDNGTSYGICQWHNTRWTDLKNFCNANGYDWTTLEGQLYFLNYELINKYKFVVTYLRNVSNDAAGAYNAAYYYCAHFEIPANTQVVADSRGRVARDTYWPKYAGAVSAGIDAQEENSGYLKMYRLYNRSTGEHLYTYDMNERDTLVMRGSWNYEGVAWLSPRTSDYPVYRMYKAADRAHHYTMDENERDTLCGLGKYAGRGRGWTYEGIGWYSALPVFTDENSPEADGYVPLHRLYNPKYPMVSAHHYTADLNEVSVLLTRGWVYEGTAWFGAKAAKE